MSKANHVALHPQSLYSLSLIDLLVLCFQFCESNMPFMKLGPQPTLVVLGISVNTWNRYMVLQFLIMCFQVTDVLVNEFASPILGFNIYNTDKVVITEFTKLQLQFYCQSLWFINNLKQALMLLVVISQIDIAISKVIYAEITSIFTIRAILNKKKFLDQSQQLEGLQPQMQSTISFSLIKKRKKKIHFLNTKAKGLKARG